MTTTLDKILKRHDKGESVATIADALSVSPGWVYALLREHRPKRERKARRTTSDFPRMIAGLHKQGLKPARIAVALGISRAYVYRHLPAS
jgi:predicted transcriptional regulator